jgi:hypothetical protein
MRMRMRWRSRNRNDAFLAIASDSAMFSSVMTTLPATAQDVQTEATPWPLWLRGGFRFTALYCALFWFANFPAWQSLAIWVAKNIVGMAEVVTDGHGSGDTSYNYAQFFIRLALALLLSLLWGLLDRRRDYITGWTWLRAWLRYYLATMMLTYGMMKLFPLQMPPPDPMRLMQRFGDASPMGMLWTFIGSAPAYQMALGGMEVLCGLLMLQRRTTLAAGLLSAAVSAQILLLNLCFDVPVKLLSSHLLAFSLLLIASDLLGLARTFFCGTIFRPNNPPRLMPTNFSHQLFQGAKYGLALYFLATQVMSSYASWQKVQQAKHDMLYGVWEVPIFNVAPLLPNQSKPSRAAPRWLHLISAYEGHAIVELFPNHKQGFQYELDMVKKTLTLFQVDDKSKQLGQFTVTQPNESILRLQGNLQGHTMTIQLKKKPLEQFQLVSRGFHWVSEYPYNR